MAKTLSLLLLLVSTAALAPEGRAEADVLCAQVVPCGEDGRVWPEFALGECADYYTRICQAKRDTPHLSDENVCSSALHKLTTQNKKLKRKVRNLNRRVRAAK